MHFHPNPIPMSISPQIPHPLNAELADGLLLLVRVIVDVHAHFELEVPSVHILDGPLLVLPVPELPLGQPNVWPGHQALRWDGQLPLAVEGGREADHWDHHLRRLAVQHMLKHKMNNFKFSHLKTGQDKIFI